MLENIVDVKMISPRKDINVPEHASSDNSSEKIVVLNDEFGTGQNVSVQTYLLTSTISDKIHTDV